MVMYVREDGINENILVVEVVKNQNLISVFYLFTRR